MTSPIVEIFNNTSCSVSIVSDRMRLTFNAPTRLSPISKKTIKMDELLDIYNAPGVAKMFEKDILLVKNPDAREMLGMQPLDKFSIGIDEIEKFIETSELEEFEEFLQYCSDTALDNVVAKAVEVSVADMRKNMLIKKYSGIDPYQVRLDNGTPEETVVAAGARAPKQAEEIKLPERRVVRRGGA